MIVVQAFPMMHPAGDAVLRSEVELRTLSALDPKTIVAECADAVALIARGPARITGQVLGALPALRVVSATGSGVDCFDVAAASALGIPVLHNPGVAPTPVVEYVLGTMLMLSRRLREADAEFRAGGAWEPKERFRGREVTGKILGLVGLGHIGGEVARRARAAFSMRVLGFDPAVTDDRFAALGVERHALPDLLAAADVVSIHAPLTEATRHLLGSDELALMRPGAVLVNASRGGIVDEAALLEALINGRLAGAAVDVFDREPPVVAHPLFALPNVIVTPHVAGLSDEASEALALAVARNLLAALRGERPPHIANPEAWPPRRSARAGAAGGT